MHRVWATSGAAREPWLAGLDVEVVGADELAERAGTDAHQGLCALVSPYPYADAAALLAGPEPWLVALDEVQDPQNVGAICRTAECAGADGVVLPERRAAAVTPAVAKASAGAVEHLAVARVRNLADFLLEARRAGCWSYGAAAVPGAVPYDEPDYAGGAVLVLGRRGAGSAPACRGRLRPARGPAAARAHRVAQRLGRGGGAAVRDLAAAPARLDKHSITLQSAASLRLDRRLSIGDI